MRVERVSSLLKQLVSDILRRHVGDARIGFISITDIDMSPDLRHATVLYSQIGNDKEKAETVLGLRAAGPFIHSALCKSSYLKRIPRIHFKFDDSLERGSYLVDKINEILQTDDAKD